MNCKSFYYFQLAFLLLIIVVIQGNVVNAQNSIIDIERDKYIVLSEYTNGILNDINVAVKFYPSASNRGCVTKNYLAVKLNGNLNGSRNFLTFDVHFKDCNSLPYFKTMSIPLNQENLRYYLNISDINISDSLYSNILGNDESLTNNNHFTFLSETIDLIDNIRINNSYEGGSAIREDLIVEPQRINVYNASGEENTNYDRAELFSKIILRIQGGFIPSGGVWVWYDDDKLKNKVGEGNSLSYLINETIAEKTFTVIGYNTKDNLKSKPVARKVYFEVKQTIINEIDALIQSGDLEKALELVNNLKDSYNYDSSIEQKYVEIKDLIVAKNSKEERDALDYILNKKYTFSIDFPEQDKEIKNEIQSLINSKGFSELIQNGSNNLNIDYSYKSYGKLKFSTPLYSELNNFFVSNLNQNFDIYSKPKKNYYKNKFTEVNVAGNYRIDVTVSTVILNAKKKKGAWVSKNPNLERLLVKNYEYYNAKNPDGLYQINYRTLNVGGMPYTQTSGKCIKREDGPHNVYKSAILLPKGRSNVGLKNGHMISYSILGLVALSTASKFYSNSQYDKFLKANDQNSLDKYYSQANWSNKIFLLSAGIGITLYSYNLITVFKKGKKNKNRLKPEDILPIKTDYILLPN